MKKFWRPAAALVALALAGALATVRPISATPDDFVRYQGPGGGPPGEATADREDFKRLRIGRFLVKIDGNPTTPTVDALDVCLDSSTVPDLDGADAAQAAQDALDAWDSEVSVNLFNFVGAKTPCDPGESVIRWGSTGRRAVGQATFPGLAFDFPSRTAFVTRFEITLNEDLDWEVGDSGDPGFDPADTAYDARGVMAHEVGHPVGLDDLNKLLAWRLTMFGSAFTDHPPNTATLGCGDILGLGEIYGEALNCTTVADD